MELFKRTSPAGVLFKPEDAFPLLRIIEVNNDTVTIEVSHDMEILIGDFLELKKTAGGVDLFKVVECQLKKAFKKSDDYGFYGQYSSRLTLEKENEPL